MTLIFVNSLDDPRLEVFRDVKATRHSRWSGRFVAEGKRLVKRLLLSDFEIESVLIAERRAEEFAPWLRPHMPTFVLPQPLAAELVGYNFHCGAMACAIRKPSPSLDDVLSGSDKRQTIVVCPDVNDPENIGTLIRLSAAFGIDALLLGPTCADPFSRRVLRVSMGNALTLPIVCSSDLLADLQRLKSEWNFHLAAAVVEDSDPTDLDHPVADVEHDSNVPTTDWHVENVPHERTGLSDIESLTDADRPPRLALLFGNEAHGLSDADVALCDRRLTIPMHGADSLNVAVAAGIFLYHFTRTAM